MAVAFAALTTHAFFTFFKTQYCITSNWCHTLYLGIGHAKLSSNCFAVAKVFKQGITVRAATKAYFCH